jgi:hypothetical protein
MDRFDECPNCGRNPPDGFLEGTHFNIYECEECGKLYCHECDNGRCPECGSEECDEVGQCWCK